MYYYFKKCLSTAESMAYYFPKAKLLLHKYSVAEKDRIPKQKPSQNATNVHWCGDNAADHSSR